MSWQIVRHAFVMVFGNFSDALKVSVGPYLIAIVGSYVITRAFGLPANFMAMAEQDPEAFLGAVPAMLLIGALYLFCFSWIAVAWHRFVLLEEYPRAMPTLAGMPVLPYIGRTLLLVLLLILISIPLSLLAGLAALPFMGASPMVGGMVVGLLLGAVLSFFWFRFAIVLPATALGRPMKTGEAWTATAPLSATIFGVTIILVALNGLATGLTLPLAGMTPIVGMAVNTVVTWVTMMIGVSILTTFYGHVVEGRDLV